LLKPRVVVRNRLREFVKVSQQILGPKKLDAQLAWLQVDAGGKVFHNPLVNVGGRRDSDFAPGRKFAVPLQVIEEPGSTPCFVLKTLAVAKALKAGNQFRLVDKEGLAGLEAAELVQQIDRAAAADPEQPLDRGTVDDGAGQGRELLQDFRNSQQPLGFGGNGDGLLCSTMLPHGCA
jgi:hypothetical protein